MMPHALFEESNSFDRKIQALGSQTQLSIVGQKGKRDFLLVPQRHRTVQINLHRLSRSSRRRATTFTGRRGLTPLSFHNALNGRRADRIRSFSR